MQDGGTGAFKLGANYAPGVVPQREAAVHGYAQNLWLHGPEHYLTEVRLRVWSTEFSRLTARRGGDDEHVRRDSQRARR